MLNAILFFTGDDIDIYRILYASVSSFELAIHNVL